MRKKIGKAVALILAVSALFASLSSCGEEERKSKTYYDYFDTVSTLYSFADDSDDVFCANAEAFRQEMATCHKLFDIYNSYDGVNNIKTVNDMAGKGAVKVDGRIIDLLSFSKEMYVKTSGAVNVAMGSVLRIWHECRGDGKRVPTEEELTLASLHCDIEKLVIDKAKGTVELLDPEMSLDVGAVAKGFAIDRAASVLRSRGAAAYAIDVGGNLYAIGEKPDGKPFKTGVENPDGGDYPAYIDVKNGAVATSGDYQRYYTVAGVTYHHIINGKTLFPSNYHRSVSVYSGSAALSDALSTALFNTESYGAARNLIRSIGGVREVIFINKNGGVERITP